MASEGEAVIRRSEDIPSTTHESTQSTQTAASPSTAHRPLDPLALGPAVDTTTSSSSLSPSPSNPTFTVTPASPIAPTSSSIVPPPASTPVASASEDPQSSTPAGEMKEKQPTDSETALVSDEEKEQVDSNLSSSGSSKPGPIQNLTRRLSGKAKDSGVSNGSTNVEEKSSNSAPVTASTSQPAASTSISPVTKPTSTTSPTSPTPATTSTKPSTMPAPSSAQTTSRSPAPKKKRKRGGFASLLLAFGCLSASDFEDEAPTKREVVQRPDATSEKKLTPPTSATPTSAPGAATGAGQAKDLALTPGAAGPTTSPSGTITLIGTGTATPVKGRVGDGDVIVAPSTPVTIPEDETAGVTSSAVQAPGSGSELLSTTPRRASQHREPSDTSADGRPHDQAQAGTSSAEAERTNSSGGYTDISESSDQDASSRQQEEYPLEDEYEDEEDRLIAQGGMGIPIDEHGNPAPLLPVMIKAHSGRKCLVLDLDETLLHSSFKMIPNADYIVPVEIESQTHNVYVIKRPGVDNFLKEMGKIYEVVVFTASLSKYADPVLDMLDTEQVVLHRLFRESCYNHKGNYVKDLSQLGRDIHETIIIDNSPASYIFHPNNAVPVSTWFNDPHDTELTDLCPFLADLATVSDVRGVLDGSI